MLLDNFALMHNLDSHNMRSQIDSLPDQFEAAWTLGQKLPIPAMFSRAERIVIAGIGAAALAGDLLAVLVADSCNIPIIVQRGYDLPAYVDGQSTLVVVVTVSGNVEETLSALDLADARGTQLLLITTNKALAQKVESSGGAAWTFEYEGVSRTAIGWMFGLLTALVNRLGLVADLSSDVAGAVEAIHSRVPLIGLEGLVVKNPAKRLAGQLIGRIPVIYGGGLTAPIARRWKSQLNENAKTWAEWDELPELNHNASSGIIFPRPIMTKLSVVVLSSPQFDHPRIAMRQTLTKNQYLQQGIGVDVIKMRGDTRLSQMLGGIQYGDYVSYYVAMCYEVDPTPTPSTTELQQLMTNSGNVVHESHD